MSADDRQVCPQCQQLYPVWYKWDDKAVMWCQCWACDHLFKMPARDERAAQIRALNTVKQVAQKVPK